MDFLILQPSCPVLSIVCLQYSGRLSKILGRLKIEFVKTFQWQKHFDADRLYIILRCLYKKFFKNYLAVFEQMGVKLGVFNS